ncbi:hypothetical protein PMI30_03398 [Pseudomonas sp. GM50]|uniref:hypothetical protein n=1 Tax=Pseudomonas sp. GM50 TaxID=1144332 RepID=UPI00027090A5|nr:hypothetical protein [Pseudomonas sp. GM50]EJM65075.1 hypothetical protein PMI30_03398 [Pseudomonas sp. GM50]
MLSNRIVGESHLLLKGCDDTFPGSGLFGTFVSHEGFGLQFSLIAFTDEREQRLIQEKHCSYSGRLCSGVKEPCLSDDFERLCSQVHVWGDSDARYDVILRPPTEPTDREPQSHLVSH